ncbi:hypothetical protein FANTH_717 [Fusarium anthophilum]|uniref:Uncharacterized protein n=1 Tax=Fusarium anthophilum TaxID=48485 RepID=A0A8H4ZXD4_9HYPO|nr:hypothetical protein FANTH_717 [Fusarium anthophilum]
MTTNQREIQRQLMKKYNIVFDGPIDSIANPQWPSTCNTIFEHIRQLGRTDYSQYRESISADFTKSPWRYQVQRRAKRITEKAKLCIESRKNESGWRLSLESEVMARFSVEIACRNCRGRLWRSEQEVTAISQSDADDANSLEARQKRRQPCNCKNNGLSREIQEQGISPLFDDRAEEAIIYSNELRAELPKREDRPDRVYGLQVTERLSRLLLAAENVRSSPFRQDGEPLVFPFLVIEAKSEKGCDAFTDTQVQTAFAIRELLSIQSQLGQVAEEDTEWDAGPLVWFLSYKGEQWRVSAAYIHDNNGKTFYRVVRLWSGGVDSLDSALQLLLIVDYIADWARDIYREGVARSLLKLASHDTQSLVRDADIFSLAGNVKEWACSSPEASEPSASQSFQDPLREFDCYAGIFRDARFVRSKFIGLIITEENVEQLLQTGATTGDTMRLVAQLLNSIRDSVRVKGGVLNELELLWTDTDRNLSNISSPDEIFYVVATSVFYLTQHFDQTRELSYVAVSESLIPDLAKIARFSNPSRRLTEIPGVNSLAVFGELLKTTPRANVSACISRLCLITGSIAKLKNGKTPSTWAMLPLEKEDRDCIIVKEAVVKTCKRPEAREFLRDIYSKHKVGRSEPSSSIFRISSSMDELANSTQSPEDQYKFSKFSWRWSHYADASSFGDNMELLFATTEKSCVENEWTPGFCVFVLDSSVAKTGIKANKILSPQKKFADAIFYHKKAGSLRGWNYNNDTNFVSGSLKWNCARLANVLREDRAFSPDHLMTKWDLLTTGWRSKIEIDEDFEFSPERPFRRRPYHHSLREALVGGKKETNLLPQQDFIVIEDDEETEEELRNPQATSVKPGRSESGSKDTAKADTGAGKEDNPDGSPCMPEDKGKKRPISAVEQVDETEVSFHLTRKTRHQESSGEMTCRQSAVDTGLENPRIDLGVASG